MCSTLPIQALPHRAAAEQGARLALDNDHPLASNRLISAALGVGSGSLPGMSVPRVHDVLRQAGLVAGLIVPPRLSVCTNLPIDIRTSQRMMGLPQRQ